MKTSIRLAAMVLAALIVQGAKAQCPQGTVTISITTDNYGEETTWVLINNITGVTVASGGPYQGNTTYNQTVCVASDSTSCYRFVIYDEFGDGMCCFYGNGSYTASYNGDTVGSGGEFEQSAVIPGIGSSCGNVSSVSVDDSTYTPQQLASGILQGTCVSVFNINYTGAPGQIGYFSDGSIMGIETGVLLTTGNATIAAGLNTESNAGFETNSPGDADLNAAAGVAESFDACALEFDFVSCDSSVSLRYVFGSEEYNEFVCSQYNDVFAFLLTGPGYALNTNIALIPGTATPVAINTVNNGTPGNFTGTPYDCSMLTTPHSLSNSSFYVDNTGGFVTQYDGYTIPLSASIIVVPSDTYHIKLVIADVGDEHYDSGIFLEAEPTTATISGKTLTETGTAIAGVTVALSGSETQTVVTDTAGRYDFVVSKNGNYTITPSKNNTSLETTEYLHWIY